MPKNKPTLLIVDDEKHTREGLLVALGGRYNVTLARDGQEAIELLNTVAFDGVLTDLRMAGPSGLAVLDHALTRENRPVCLMMTAYGDVDTAVAAMKRGAADFITKPLKLEELELALERAFKARFLEDENAALHERLDKKYHFKGLVGHSIAFKEVVDAIQQVAPSKATVLLQGETGTGKELVAQLIHQNSPRARGPFVAVHCGALPNGFLENELFGHEKGAFPGSAERRIGRFESADSGTLFLDEVGDLDAATQIKLLRFLETKTLERLGSIKPIVVDVRLIAATRQDLLACVKAGTFREDLYYRLSVLPIHLPALRERREDVLPLLQHFLQIFSKENKLPIPVLTPQATRILEGYSWPGNIAQLRNVAENLVVLARGRQITPEDLPLHFLMREGSQDPQEGFFLDEKAAIKGALAKAKGNKTAAAALLGISRRTLHRKLAQWPELED